MRYLISGIITLFITFSHQISAQKLTHVLGEILVQTDSEQSLSLLKNELAQKSNNIKGYKEITRMPSLIHIVKFDQNKTNEYALLETIKSSKHIRFAQFNHLIEYRLTPNDARFEEQWQYINLGFNGGTEGADIDMDLAWDYTTGGVTALGDTIVSCIIDDGINPNHDDFEDNIWVNLAEIPNNGIDDDNNGYVDDINGWDVYNNSGDIYRGGGHGTPVAGIVGAKGNNGIGVAGVNWDAKLMIIRGGGNEANALASYSYPYEMRKKYNETDGQEGAFVVTTNASWGTDFGQPEDAPIWCSFYDSLGVVGILSCGATINGNVNVDEQGDLPTGCSSEYLIAVTNMNRNDNKVTGAGYGPINIDLGAFGAETFTTSSPNNYGGFGGTSGATPHVAGTVALLYASDCLAFIETAKANPQAAAGIARDYILNGVDPNESLEGITVTEGRLNVANTMEIMDVECQCPSPTSLSAEVDFIEATVSWNAPDTMGHSVSLRFRSTLEDEWNELTNVTSPTTIDNLSACTVYEVQLKSQCDSIPGGYFFTYEFETEACCQLNTSLKADYDEVNDIISLDWNGSDVPADYVIEYKQSNFSDWQQVAVTDTFFSIEDLEECTSYDFRLQTQCEYDTSAFHNPIRVATACGNCTSLDYCEASRNNSLEFISIVQLHTLSNNSSAEENGYGNYAGFKKTELEQGREYTIVVGPGWDGIADDEFFNIWIDWNQDGTLDDIELIASSTDGTRQFYFEDFTVPTDAEIGYTKMRVVMDDAINPPACGFDGDGEIEDYCISISENPSLSTAEDNRQMLTISPNPFINKFEIKYDNMVIGLLITDMNGAIIKSIEKPAVKNGIITIENLELIPTGIYFLNVLDENGNRNVKKVIKI